MTESLPLYKRLQTEALKAHSNLLTCTLTLALAVMKVDDPQTAYEFAVAIDNMLSSVGVPDLPLAIPTALPWEASDVPLYKRLQDSDVGIMIGKALFVLNCTSMEIPKGDLQDAYNTAMKAFWAELGIPTVEEVKANPEQYPDISQGLMALKERADEIALLEEIYKGAEAS